MSEDRIIPDKLLANTADDYKHLLLLLAAHPAPEPFATFYKVFAACLATKFEALGILEHVYIYTPQQLHITVATLHPSKLASDDLTACASVWGSVLSENFHKNEHDNVGLTRRGENGIVNDKLRERSRPRLQLRDGNMDDGVGVLLWEDTSTVFSDWRDSIREISKRPDVVRMLKDAGSDATSNRLPEIVHSTVLRWRSTPKVPAHDLKSLFTDTLREVLEAHGGCISIYVDSVRIVEEEARCMERAKTHWEFSL